MSAAPAVDALQPPAVPRLLVELPPRREVFFENLRDLLSPRPLPALELRSTPAAFWPDVFVQRRLPWDGLIQSSACHLIAFGLLMGLTRLLAIPPRVVPAPRFDHSEVIHYQPSEYLPPLDTRTQTASPKKADPEFSRQAILSVPAEADNRKQTIVTPPRVKLRRDLDLPNMIAWSDAPEKPRLDIPPAPLTPASEITRIGPKLDRPVVTPPPDAARIAHPRDPLALQNSVVAPPPDVHAATAPGFEGLQAAAIAPPPTIDTPDTRRPGTLNIAPTTVIAPAPQLPVAAQRTVPAAGMGASQSTASQVVPPPPSLSGSSAPESSFGARGRVIALNLHPAVSAPPDPPAGNRRGSFARTPDGRPGASGSPGASSTAAGTGATTGNGADGTARGNAAKKASDLPAGLYVGKTPAESSPIAGEPGNKSAASVNPNLVASVHPPRVSSTQPMQPGNPSKLSEAERAVFGNRHFYSATLNMPNLNSAGGSWVIRFAELNHESAQTDATQPDSAAPSPDLTQPMATRKVDPAYPMQLMRENVSGTVILYAVIHADGSVGNVRVLRGVDDRLDRFASDAVAQWKFEPATKKGSPVEVEATFQIPFRPARIGSNF